MIYFLTHAIIQNVLDSDKLRGNSRQRSLIRDWGLGTLHGVTGDWGARGVPKRYCVLNSFCTSLFQLELSLAYGKEYWRLEYVVNS